MLFISHNLGLVMDVCDRICVMYSGEAVETGTVGTYLIICVIPIHRLFSALSRFQVQIKTPDP